MSDYFKSLTMILCDRIKAYSEYELDAAVDLANIATAIQSENNQ